MSKSQEKRYNKETMKTLDAKALKARKDNLHAEFEREKQEALKYEKIVEAASKKRDQHLEKMSKLQAAHSEIEELEKQIGIDPLSTRSGAPEKPKK